MSPFLRFLFYISFYSFLGEGCQAQKLRLMGKHHPMLTQLLSPSALIVTRVTNQLSTYDVEID